MSSNRAREYFDFLADIGMTWLKPPHPEIRDLFKRAAYAEALDTSGWTELMDQAGLVNLVGNSSPLDVSQESKGRVERYGRWGILKIILKMLAAVIKDRKYRSYLKDGTSGLSKDLLKVVGFGVYVGQKT